MKVYCSSKEKLINIVCRMVLIFLAGWFLLFLVQLMRWTNAIDITIGLGTQIRPIAWSSVNKVLTIQWVELIGYSLSTVILIFLSSRFIITCLGKLDIKRLFNRHNTKLLWGITITDFFFEFFSLNIEILFGLREIQISSEMIISPLLFLIMTLMYEVAVSITEENELTI
ncbi:hypothetical protein [Prevotella sp. KH2C16]|uniref:hypothetical protein n=1 Tax=Prevotella sp. KH2C16 TaxID=1855325 RepID=UPI0008E78EC2|nr:hypothetical protein [Prevotella sp. KH2C16]SFG76175.1 hypothetical protein SAMN05216383_1405 [Prevotella sp. KH2C16]